MKKFKIVLALSLVFCLSGCFKADNMEDIDIYTTVYPIEYVTDYLYGQHSKVKSIYPDGVNVNDYELNEKQITDYSTSTMYIFNGLGKEKDYVVPMINSNDDLKINDATSSMEYTHGVEELWLDPANLLMIAKNIDSGLNEYINNTPLKNDIATNYEQLKIELSELDAKMRLIAEASDNKTIIVGNEVFKYLEKYGFNVISLDETDELTDKTISDVQNLIVNQGIKYIYVKKGLEANQTVQYFKTNYDVKIIELHPLSNISEQQREDKKDYFSLMNENIDLLKKSIYK